VVASTKESELGPIMTENWKLGFDTWGAGEVSQEYFQHLGEKGNGKADGNGRRETESVKGGQGQSIESN